MGGPGDDVPLLSETRYEELSDGQRWGPFAEELEPGDCDALRGAIGEGSPGRFAPPGTLPLVTLRVLRRALRGIPPGGVLMRHHFALLAPIAPGLPLSVAVRVSGQDRRASGLYTTFAFTISQDDVVAATVDWMILAPPGEAEAGPGEAGAEAAA